MADILDKMNGVKREEGAGGIGRTYLAGVKTGGGAQSGERFLDRRIFEANIGRGQMAEPRLAARLLYLQDLP